MTLQGCPVGSGFYDFESVNARKTFECALYSHEKRLPKTVPGSPRAAPVSVIFSIKGRKPFANLRKTVIYITDIDLVNDNEYTKFSLILSICSQVIE